MTMKKIIIMKKKSKLLDKKLKYDISHIYEKQVEILSQNYGILCPKYEIESLNYGLYCFRLMTNLN